MRYSEDRIVIVFKGVLECQIAYIDIEIWKHIYFAVYGVVNVRSTELSLMQNINIIICASFTDLINLSR